MNPNTLPGKSLGERTGCAQTRCLELGPTRERSDPLEASVESASTSRLMSVSSCAVVARH